jgi:NADPH:quinone reductase-like Zn-dependent oxidoreductase
MMRAWEIGDQSSDLTLRMVERPIPRPGPGELLYRVHATGLNARDLWLMRRKDMATRVPCSDNIGTIAATGPGVTGFAVGERVTVTHYAQWLAGDWDESYTAFDHGNTVDGFLAEYAIALAAAAVKVSDRLPDEEACTLATAGLTSWRALAIDARPEPGEIVLTLGTGGVSVFCLQVAQWFGARVIITSSSDAKLERMKMLGADMTVNYRTNPDWSEELLRLTGGQGADVVLNNVGYPEIESCLKSCANNARVIHIGASRQTTQFGPLQNFFMKDCSIKGIANGSRRMLQEFLRAADQHQLRPVVDQVFEFEQAIEAVRAMEGANRVGKLVIRVSPAR